MHDVNFPSHHFLTSLGAQLPDAEATSSLFNMAVIGINQKNIHQNVVLYILLIRNPHVQKNIHLTRIVKEAENHEKQYAIITETISPPKRTSNLSTGPKRQKNMEEQQGT